MNGKWTTFPFKVRIEYRSDSKFIVISCASRNPHPSWAHEPAESITKLLHKKHCSVLLCGCLIILVLTIKKCFLHTTCLPVAQFHLTTRGVISACYFQFYINWASCKCDCWVQVLGARALWFCCIPKFCAKLRVVLDSWQNAAKRLFVNEFLHIRAWGEERTQSIAPVRWIIFSNTTKIKGRSSLRTSRK